MADPRRDRSPATVKGRGNLATEADTAAEREIISVIRAEFPAHSVVAEESGAHSSRSAYEWLIDPLDGSFNYSRGIPWFGISLALALNGRPILGVICDPNRSELFSAIRGCGARLNGVSISTIHTSSLRAAVLGFDLGYDNEKGLGAINRCRKLWGRYQTFRSIGSCALGLAYVAAGRLDLYFHHSVYPWDYAAGWLLVEETGGIVTAADGQPMRLSSGSVIGAGARVHAEFLAASAREGRDD